MQALLRIAVAAVIVLAIVSFMTTYSVRFTDAAVLTTFGRADESSVQREPGLKFKLPYPIQSVTRYDTRARFLETRPETQQTADDRQIIVTAFLTWRVADPLVFYRRFSIAGGREIDHYREAENVLRSKLRSAMSEVSRFRLNELLAASLEGSRIGDLEGGILGLLQAQGGDLPAVSDYGIEAVAVGVSSVRLPKETASAVFERMGATRDRIAAEAVSQGKAAAEAIRGRAKADEATIMAFAEQRAQEIRKQGDIEAARFYARLNENPELAVFLKTLEFIREAYGKRTTLVLPVGSWPGLNYLRPDLMETVKPGELPPFELRPPGTPATSSDGAAAATPGSEPTARRQPEPPTP